MLEVLVSRTVVQSAQLVDQTFVVKVEARVRKQLQRETGISSVRRDLGARASTGEDTTLKTSHPITLDDPEAVLAHERDILAPSQDREHLVDWVPETIVVRLGSVGDANEAHEAEGCQHARSRQDRSRSRRTR